MIVVEGVTIDVIEGDALATDVDVLALKYAQALYGVDKEAARRLLIDAADLPAVGDFRTFASDGATSARQLLLIGVPPLRDLLYDEISEFGRLALTAAASVAPLAQSIAVTLHGPGYGLDELACLESELNGLAEALRSSDAPSALQRIVFVVRRPCARYLASCSRDTREEFEMAEIRDKTRNVAQTAKGKAKEAAGKSTGNRKLESKGKADQTKAKVKKTGEKVKDVFR